MSRLPRILPLAAVAIGGVLALKALAQVDALPKMLAGAQAFAEDAAKPLKVATAKVPGAPVLPPSPKVAATGPAAGVAAQAGICAPSPVDLAREAGLSPAELQVLQSLGSRRTQLDQREQDIDTQLKLLAAAEIKLDTKLKGLNGLKADLQALVGQAEQKESAEIDRLVIVYSKMKPRDAAPVITQLDDKVRIPVAAKMKEAALAAVLSQMAPAEAKKLTESLARRYDKVQELAQNAANPPPAAPAPSADAAAAPAKAVPATPGKARRPARRHAAAPAAAAARAVAQAPAAPAAPAKAPPAATAAAAPSATAKPAPAPTAAAAAAPAAAAPAAARPAAG